ncbi:type II secretion system F family protein [Alcaligenaceae bacterium A4P071]|nr:type II secretion system F family protein [Alcaligenaceae bacterium A4P071]
MMALAVTLAALALIALMGGALLWRAAGTRAQKAAGAKFIDGRLASQQAASAVPEPKSAAAPISKKRAGFRVRWWDRLLARAGIVPSRAFHVRLGAVVLVAPLLATLLASLLAGGVVLLCACLATVFTIWLRADRRRRRIVEQLPDFLDAMVRLITIGNSMPAAFQEAAKAANTPLADVLARAVSQTRSGKELDVALTQVARHYGIAELQLIAAIIAVAMRFGGRSDHVLDRMAAFIRDLEQARNELVAMSAEVRLSAWVLALLPVFIAGFIITFNTQLFMTMYEDPLGFKMLIGAVVLQVVGSYWLYRMAKSI